MASKKIFIIALILMVMVVGIASASDFREGHYRASNGYILRLAQYDDGSWYISYMNEDGKTRGTYDGVEVASNLITFKAYGTTYRISRSGNRNTIVENYEGRTYTWYTD